MTLGPPIRETIAKGAPDYFEDGAIARPWGVTRGKIAFDPPAETASDLQLTRQELADGPGLVSGGFERGDDLKSRTGHIGPVM